MPWPAALGGALLATQPLVVVVQFVVATRWETPYRLDVDTISELGAVTCSTIGATAGPVAGCSPWHALMNATFLVIGLALALGGGLLWTLRDRAPRAAAVLLLVAGLSSAAVGLVPLDVDGELHSLVATPLFVTQPLALLLLTGWLFSRHRVVALVLGVAGTVAAVGAVGFGLAIATQAEGGLLERVALWPCHLALATLGTWLVLTWRVSRVVPHGA